MWAQCNFKKKDSEKTTQGWINAKYAKIGMFMQLLDLGEDFWEVTFVGNTTDKDPSISYRTWNNNI
jgi:hypothetical protein